ncbi:MAG: rRNA maturation RNase YbeY [Candidatus Tectomicrobia bacterium]
MAIWVQNRQRTVAIDTPRVKKRLQQMLTYLGCGETELSVVFANDRMLRHLNRTYRQQDRPTNVLAFPQPPMPGVGTSPTLLGDVIVSLPTAAREARELEQSVENRVLYLLLHGILHLLGHDHERSSTERRRMETLEHAILAYLQAAG